MNTGVKPVASNDAGWKLPGKIAGSKIPSFVPRPGRGKTPVAKVFFWTGRILAEPVQRPEVNAGS